jgi:hypothetical protein
VTSAPVPSDFNGDALSDILWQNTSGQAAIWGVNGINAISGGSVSPSPGPSWTEIGSGDLNGDRHAGHPVAGHEQRSSLDLGNEWDQPDGRRRCQP